MAATLKAAVNSAAAGVYPLPQPKPAPPPASRPGHSSTAPSAVRHSWEPAHRRLEVESLAAAACIDLLRQPGKGLQLMAAAYARPSVEPIFRTIDKIIGRQDHSVHAHASSPEPVARSAPIACAMAIVRGSASLIALGVKTLVLIGASFVALAGLALAAICYGPTATAHRVKERVFEGILLQGIEGHRHRELAHLLREGYALWTEQAAEAGANAEGPQGPIVPDGHDERRTAFAASFWQYIAKAGTGMLGKIDGKVLQQIGAKASAWGFDSDALVALLRGPAADLPWAQLLQGSDQSEALAQLWRLFGNAEMPSDAPTLQQILAVVSGQLDPTMWTELVARISSSAEISAALTGLSEMAPGALGALIDAISGPMQALPWANMVKALADMPHMDEVLKQALTELSKVDLQQFAPLFNLQNIPELGRGLQPLLQSLDKLLAEKGDDIEQAVKRWLDPSVSGPLQRSLGTLLMKLVEADASSERWEQIAELLARLSAALNTLMPDVALPIGWVDDVTAHVDRRSSRLRPPSRFGDEQPVRHIPEVVAKWRPDAARVGTEGRFDRYTTAFTKFDFKASAAAEVPRLTERQQEELGYLMAAVECPPAFMQMLNDDSGLKPSAPVPPGANIVAASAEAPVATLTPEIRAQLRLEIESMFAARKRTITVERQSRGTLRMHQYVRAELKQSATGTESTKRVFARRQRQETSWVHLRIDCALPKSKLIHYKSKLHALKHFVSKQRAIGANDEAVLTAVRESLTEACHSKLYTRDVMNFGTNYSESFYAEAAEYVKNPSLVSVDSPGADELLRIWRREESCRVLRKFLQLRIHVIVPDGVPYFNWLAKTYEAETPNARVLGVVILRGRDLVADPDNRLICVHDVNDLRGNLSNAIGHALSSLDSDPTLEPALFPF